jgi:predicted MPP superfamily phosphohydrolase
MGVVRVVIFLLVSGLAHFLAARWLLSTMSPPQRARRRRVVMGTAALCASLLAAMRVISTFHETAFTRTLVAVMMLELGAVVIALLPIGVMTLVGRAVGFFARGAGANAHANANANANANDAADVALQPSATAPSVMVSRRQAIERVAGVGLFGVTGTALGWGMARGRHAYVIEEVVVRVTGWPRALEGYTIAQVSDVHVGAFVGDRELDEGFELVRKIRPDLVVATGDLVDFDSGAIGPLALRLANAGARDGAYAILGNHDHYAGPGDVVAGLNAMKVRALCNESVRIRGGDGGGFALLGVDDIQGRSGRTPGFNGPDLYEAGKGLDADVPRILLAHQPRYFDEAAGRVALQLSGHTHGGQINPGFRLADLFMRFVAGRYERDGSTLWVNRGFGVAGPPSRVGAPPEVTKIVLIGA